MGKQTRKELEDLEYYVELAKSRLKDANPALLTFGRVLTALLQDRLATLPEEAKPSEVEALWRETLPQGQAGWLSGDPFKEGTVVGKPQPERCGGSPGKPNWKARGRGTDAHPERYHQRHGLPGCEQGPEFGELPFCLKCPGCADCAKPWHLQAAEAIWEAEERSQEAGYLRRKAPSVKEIAALILKYAPEARRQGEQPTSHHEPG